MNSENVIAIQQLLHFWKIVANCSLYRAHFKMRTLEISLPSSRKIVENRQNVTFFPGASTFFKNSHLVAKRGGFLKLNRRVQKCAKNKIKITSFAPNAILSLEEEYIAFWPLLFWKNGIFYFELRFKKLHVKFKKLPKTCHLKTLFVIFGKKIAFVLFWFGKTDFFSPDCAAKNSR